MKTEDLKVTSNGQLKVGDVVKCIMGNERIAEDEFYCITGFTGGLKLPTVVPYKMGNKVDREYGFMWNRFELAACNSVEVGDIVEVVEPKHNLKGDAPFEVTYIYIDGGRKYFHGKQNGRKFVGMNATRFAPIKNMSKFDKPVVFNRGDIVVFNQPYGVSFNKGDVCKVDRCQHNASGEDILYFIRLNDLKSGSAYAYRFDQAELWFKVGDKVTFVEDYMKFKKGDVCKVTKVDNENSSLEYTFVTVKRISDDVAGAAFAKRMTKAPELEVAAAELPTPRLDKFKVGDVVVLNQHYGVKFEEGDVVRVTKYSAKKDLLPDYDLVYFKRISDGEEAGAYAMRFDTYEDWAGYPYKEPVRNPGFEVGSYVKALDSNGYFVEGLSYKITSYREWTTLNPNRDTITLETLGGEKVSGGGYWVSHFTPVSYKEAVLSIPRQSAQISLEVPGGSTPSQYELPADATELQDLIEYRNMNFAVGNIFKAAYRLGTKEGTSAEYDLNKIIFFAQRELDRIKGENE